MKIKANHLDATINKKNKNTQTILPGQIYIFVTTPIGTTETL